MLLETSYHNKKDVLFINELVGEAFSFRQTLKLGGIGSKRMIIDSVSVNMTVYINKIADITYANIELRPKGVLILINKRLKNFTWIIPYYQLAVYKTNVFSIHAQGKFIGFRQNRLYRENKKFIDKLLALRADYSTDNKGYH